MKKLPGGMLHRAVAAVALLLGGAQPALAQDTDLAKKLSNPIASLVSVPFQLNSDSGYGSTDGSRMVLNIQPVMPFSISEDWILISRTIVPIVWDDLSATSGTQSGIGDVVQSLFFSPKAPTSGGLIWGAGPVFLLPTASDDRLGGEKWGAGLTFVGLKQSGPWTYGALANHIWSVAGDSSRNDVSATFLQPFLSYTTPEAWTLSLNLESTYDWEGESWSVPVNAAISKLVRFGKQPVSFQAGVRHWAETPAGGPEDLGFRVAVTFLFPKGS
jgi:hypothetical protein